VAQRGMKWEEEYIIYIDFSLMCFSLCNMGANLSRKSLVEVLDKGKPNSILPQANLHHATRSMINNPPKKNHHKHQGLDPLIRSVSRVTTVLAKVSSIFQLFFLVVCSDMIYQSCASSGEAKLDRMSTETPGKF
jgi:hypothetical protein